MSITTDDVEALRSMLSALPRHQPKTLTKQQAIAALASEIAAAQRRGYPAGDLAHLLSEKGIDVNGPMVRHYLRKIRNRELALLRRQARRARRRPRNRVEPMGVTRA